MNADEAARRYGTRPGFHLICARDVGLPVLRVTLLASILETLELPAIEQFVLKAVAASLATPENVAGFLGLSQQLVDRAIVNLMTSDDLILAGAGTDGPDREVHRMALTRKGATTVEQLRTVVPTQVEIRLFVDVLTRRISADGSFPRVTRRGLEDTDLLDIVRTSKWRPELADFPRDQVGAALGERGLGRGRRQLLGVVSVERRERFYRADTVALAYEADNGKERQVGFVVGGVLSPDHELAFAQQNRDRWDLLFDTDNSDRSLLKELLPDLPPLASQSATSRAASLRGEALAQLAAPIPDGSGDLGVARAAESDVADPAERLEVAERSLEPYTVRWVEVHEHHGYLHDAIDKAQARLVIVSPWIRRAVVDKAFINSLRRMTKRRRGVDRLWNERRSGK